MLAVSIIAAGVIAVAAALLIRRVLDARVVGERGFARQAAGVADPMAGGGLGVVLLTGASLFRR